VPQERSAVDHWEFNREAIEFIPLLIETRGASGVWSATTAYTVQAQRVGTRPSSAAWVSPTTISGETGYLVNGPALDSAQIGGDFLGYYKLVAAPETAVEDAFTLKLL
jgi:hypothetical protein